MYPLAIAVFAVTMLLSMMNNANTHRVTSAAGVVADVDAANFWSYRLAVSSYVYANPGTTGTVPDSVLSFPLGYIRNQAWSNQVSGGVLYTYSVAALPAGAVGAIAQRGGLAMTVGTAKGGVMTSYTNAATGFTLPSGIAGGAIVVIGN